MPNQSAILRFIEEVVSELKSSVGVEPSEIPFLIAPITQKLATVDAFVCDIKNYEYTLHFRNKEEDDWYTIGYMDIHFNECDIDYIYTIRFYDDPRSWGYCHCSDGDKDYRIDKGCCGHGCDWYAPAFEISKVTTLCDHRWDGDAHSFWEFEDSFLKSDLQLKTEIAYREKESRIAHLIRYSKKYRRYRKKKQKEWG